jgi:hypothetical protein
LGKSGTSRTAARSFSSVFKAIGANASGLLPNVNQACSKTTSCSFPSFSLFNPGTPSPLWANEWRTRRKRQIKPVTFHYYKSARITIKMRVSAEK